MPDISNEDLMKLIYRVIKKVDIIEAKLDRLLEERDEKSPLETIDHGFSFTPIANDKDLQLVTQKIQHEVNYTENLRHFIENQKGYTLEDIFMPEYLIRYSYYGMKGMKKLKGLVVFEQIYVYLKSLNGLPLRDIKLLAMQELRKCKKRIGDRKRKKRHDEALASMENSTNAEYEETEYVLEMENEREPPCKILRAEENVSMDSDIDDLDEDTMEPEPRQVLIKVYQEIDREDKEDDDGVTVYPITNDAELENVTHKIQNNPQYLTQLRIQIVEESEDGQCSLTQIFSPDFLNGCTVYGFCQKKKLIDLVPYKEVYFYLKSHMGLSLKEIEKEAMHELLKIKKRIQHQRFKEKRNEIVPK